jgi:Ca2+-binding RTX toxin-like protein
MFVNFSVLVPTPLGFPIPTYGNYGGPNYATGGPPVDPLDTLFLAHDFVYDLSTDPLTRALADLALIQGIIAVPESQLDPEARVYAGVTILAMINQIGVVNGHPELLAGPAVLLFTFEAAQLLQSGLAGLDPAEAQAAQTWVASVIGATGTLNLLETVLELFGTDLHAGGPAGDFIFGGPLTDIAYGLEGGDWLALGAGADAAFGGPGEDSLFGEAGNDWLDGGDGNDAMFGGAGDDVIGGGAGADAMNGDDGNDLMTGGAGNDVMVGGAGNDAIFGELGDDWLYGGEGADVLAGGPGVDGIFTGTGNDLLVFDVASSGLDVVFDGVFGAGAGDQVAISNAGFVDTFAELQGLMYQDGSDVVIAFNATSGVYLKGYTVDQLSSDDFLFA